ncbi:MAG: DUF3795 domain-containing protein [Oligoflexia bacterium]|nr:DUF3795 domain-containing protein [Oligoflexia bacterium]
MNQNSSQQGKSDTLSEIPCSEKLVSYCGLYCGACGRYLKGACLGCAESVGKTWCKIRSCCVANEYHSCANCKKITEYQQCKNFNNLIARFFSWIFKSDRVAGLEKIKKEGMKEFASYMSKKRTHSIKKK